jgi:two-component system OmpR family sensor kinase
VANEAAAGIQVQFPHRNLTISVPENLPRVLVSRRVLYRVFWELMKNAVQVAQEPVEIRVGGERSFDKLRFWVADNGPGITVPHPEKLFEPFARSDPQASSAQAPPGFPERLRGSEVEESFGLGLFLVSQVVARWQGSLHLASAPGQGATFTVSLPQPSGEEG